MTDVAYPQLTIAQNIFKSLLWTPAVESGLAAIFASSPWLNVPIIRNIVRAISERVTEYLFNNGIKSIDMSAIKYVNTQHQKEYDHAFAALSAIARAKGIDSDEFKISRQLAQNALARFVSYGGK